MKLLLEAMRSKLLRPRGLVNIVLAALLALIPCAALAAGSEASVVLNFTDQDKIYLYISLGLGFVALAVGWVLAQGVLKQSPGNEKMQAVGLAIREGAMSYLKRQFMTMIWFVLALAIGLYFLYANNYNSQMLGVYIAASFIGGVAASYIAGYSGMVMAVAGNMRTANAALTSYKASLEVAFRSGAVAGMVTVGMGLIGATAIFLLAGSDAMKLLIGFGFGGSLAALFMRVGGGIFTKAADVGADLVGKVEAGIPEDDPRNPATIADNVGDNVGDCAGMAADIFESYEVTLVAAIVLGAATSVIFDQATWMKLIIFALMARGVGIVASIIGIYSVRGSDNIDADPLKAIRRGFQVSAIVAALGTLGLAWWMMGGNGNEISTRHFEPAVEAQKAMVRQIQKERNRIAKDKEIPPYAVAVKEVAESELVKKLNFNLPEDQLLARVDMMMNATADTVRAVEQLKHYRQVDLKGTSPFLDYAVQRGGMGMTPPEVVSVREAFKNATVITGRQNSGTGPTAGKTEFTVLTLDPAALETQIKAAPKEQGLEVVDKKPAVIYATDDGEIALGATGVDNPLTLNSQVQESVIPMSVEEYKKKDEDRKNKSAALEKELQKILEDAQKAKGEAQQKLFSDYSAKQAELTKVQNEARDANPLPRGVPVEVGLVHEKTVPWYMFFAPILFGILMAFAIEMLTDYYVSTHKKPVQEVAGVSNAGPAPMIIQGFALGLESSVFSVFAIVVALLAPLFFFPPADYGSYILSFYGIALVGLGLLTTTGYILAMDTFGPISDNAQGVFEMSGAGHESPSGSKAVQRLDAAGNTTKALTKGFAIATAVVAAVALFHSYVEDAKLTSLGLKLDIPEIFLGLLIGGAAPYLFSAFSINAVGRAAFTLINEVREQFRNDPGIMAGTSKPNYDRCVAIVTKAAQTELLGPGILAIALPAAVAFGFSIGKPTVAIGAGEYNLVGAQALGGFLAGAILSGQLMAVLLANSGGIWDNAKKLIEDGLYGGKGSEAHKAGVVCDTVGDPFKDTAGPALNPLIKVMNLVALLLAPIVILPLSNAVLSTITIVCVLALAFSVWWSKRGSMSSAMSQAQAVGHAGSDAFDTGKDHAPIGAPAPDIAPETKPKRKLTVEDEDEDES